MKKFWTRILDELSQAWIVTLKDIKVYYLRPGMIMFGFLMPFFMFFSFSVRRDMGAGDGMSRLLALTIFFTAAAAGPFIIPTERRQGTYDRLLAANMFGTKTVLLLSVVAFLYGRPDFLDLALVYALINFIGVIAVLEFIRDREDSDAVQKKTGE